MFWKLMDISEILAAYDFKNFVDISLFSSVMYRCCCPGGEHLTRVCQMGFQICVKKQTTICRNGADNGLNVFLYRH